MLAPGNTPVSACACIWVCGQGPISSWCAKTKPGKLKAVQGAHNGACLFQLLLPKLQPETPASQHTNWLQQMWLVPHHYALCLHIFLLLLMPQPCTHPC